MKLCIWKDILLFYEGRNGNIGVKRRISFPGKLMEKGDRKVSEGPTDHMVLKAVIDRITGEENRYLSLQPKPDMMGRFGNGWKGVWRWCKETDSIRNR